MSHDKLPIDGPMLEQAPRLMHMHVPAPTSETEDIARDLLALAKPGTCTIRVLRGERETDYFYDG